MCANVYQLIPSSDEKISDLSELVFEAKSAKDFAWWEFFRIVFSQHVNEGIPPILCIWLYFFPLKMLAFLYIVNFKISH